MTLNQREPSSSTRRGVRVCAVALLLAGGCVAPTGDVGSQEAELVEVDVDESLFGLYETTLRLEAEGALVVGDTFDVVATTEWQDVTITSRYDGMLYGTTTCELWASGLFNLHGEFRSDTTANDPSSRFGFRVVLDDVITPNLIEDAPDFTNPRHLVFERWTERRTFTCAEAGPFSLSYDVEVGSTEYFECDAFLSSRHETRTTRFMRVEVEGHCWDPEEYAAWAAELEELRRLLQRSGEGRERGGDESGVEGRE